MIMTNLVNLRGQFAAELTREEMKNVKGTCGQYMHTWGCIAN